MSKKPTIKRQMSLKSNKSNNIDTITSLSRATSYNSSDNKKPIIKFIYDDTKIRKDYLKFLKQCNEKNTKEKY